MKNEMRMHGWLQQPLLLLLPYTPLPGLKKELKQCKKEIKSCSLISKCNQGLWWCCREHLLEILLENWSGICALVQLATLSPWHFNHPASLRGDLSPKVKEVQAGWLQVCHLTHMFIQIGVPWRGVPDKFKAKNQIIADFKSVLLWWFTVNKNAD
jgi:hypothetical protein